MEPAQDVTTNLDLVPPEFLEPPDADDQRHLLRDEAAELIDGYLRRLARQEARGRGVLGRLAARLLDVHAHRDLGFTRLSDYTRERLGLSGREVQLLARVARRLATLPLLSDAFERGQLNWTKLRLLVEIASPADERVWLELSHGATATDLARLIAEHGAGETRSPANTEAASPPAPSRLNEDAGGADCDDEPRLRVKLTCPRRVATTWRLALATASKVAGGELCEWQAAEAIAAEGLSAGPHEHVGERPERHHPAIAAIAATTPTTTTQPARPKPPSQQPPGQSSNRPADQASGGPSEEPSAQPSDQPSDDIASEGFGETRGEPFEPADLQALRRALDWSALRDGLPAHIEALAEDLGSATPHEIDARLRATLRAMQRTDWQIGRLLRTFFNLRLYLHVGFPTSAAYITDRLGMSVRKARGLYRLESNCLRRGLGLTDAYRNGRVSWCRAHALLPVLDDGNASAWLERAQHVTLRRLADEVAWACDLRDTTPGSSSPLPPRLGTALDLDRYGPAMQFGAHAPAPATGDPTRLGHAGTTDVDTDIIFSAPASVAFLLRDAIDAFRRPRGPAGPAEPAWIGLLRLLMHVLDTWDALPRHRDPVFARDGWRCRVPACSSRRNLQDHHVVFRSQGGGNELRNRVAVCAWHHLRAIHTGRVRAHLVDDGRVSWEIGRGVDGRPLLRTVDDIYLPAPPRSGWSTPAARSRSTTSPATM